MAKRRSRWYSGKQRRNCEKNSRAFNCMRAEVEEDLATFLSFLRSSFSLTSFFPSTSFYLSHVMINSRVFPVTITQGVWPSRRAFNLDRTINK